MFNNDYDVLTAYEAMDYSGIGESSIYTTTTMLQSQYTTNSDR